MEQDHPGEEGFLGTEPKKGPEPEYYRDSDGTIGIRIGPPPRPKRPVIEVLGRRLRDISWEAMEAVMLANKFETRFFQRCNRWVEVHDVVGSGPQIAVLSRDAVRGRLDRVANFERDGEPTTPTLALAADMMSLPVLPLPYLAGMAFAPIYAPSGALMTKNGYDAETCFWLALSGASPTPPAKPTPEQVEAARHLILVELLGDFEFASDADKANMVALLLQPFVRLMIPGMTPFFLLEAAVQGSGKTKLGRMVAFLFTGRDPAVMPQGVNDEEYRKKITAALLAAMSFVFFDNITEVLESGALAAALTTPVWADRKLGLSENIEVQNRATWIGTGNNVRVDGDMRRRIVSVRLEPSVERPEDRTGFRHPDLEGWAAEARPTILNALYTLVNHWLTCGRPAWSKPALGSYEAWSRILGGILEAAGIPGFLENRTRFGAGANAESAEALALATAWWNEHQDKPLDSEGVLTIARAHRLFEWVYLEKGDVAARIAMGTRLHTLNGRVVGEYKFEALPKDGHLKTARHRLRRLIPAPHAPALGVRPSQVQPASESAEGAEGAGTSEVL